MSSKPNQPQFTFGINTPLSDSNSLVFFLNAEMSILTEPGYEVLISPEAAEFKVYKKVKKSGTYVVTPKIGAGLVLIQTDHDFKHVRVISGLSEKNKAIIEVAVRQNIQTSFSDESMSQFVDKMPNLAQLVVVMAETFPKEAILAWLAQVAKADMAAILAELQGTAASTLETVALIESEE